MNDEDAFAMICGCFHPEFDVEEGSSLLIEDVRVRDILQRIRVADIARAEKAEAEITRLREALTETAVAIAGGRHKAAASIARAALSNSGDSNE